MVKHAKIMVPASLACCFTILSVSCKTSSPVLLCYPTDIAFELVQTTNIRSWRLLPSNEAYSISKKIRQINIDHDVWPERIKNAETRHAVQSIVFEAGPYYAVYWLFNEEFHGKCYYYYGICFKKNNYNDVIFSSNGNYNLKYEEME